MSNNTIISTPPSVVYDGTNKGHENDEMDIPLKSRRSVNSRLVLIIADACLGVFVFGILASGLNNPDVTAIVMAFMVAFYTPVIIARVFLFSDVIKSLDRIPIKEKPLSGKGLPTDDVEENKTWIFTET